MSRHATDDREGRSSILQGTLDMMVLKTLEAMGPMHGFGIARRIEQIAEDALQVNQAPSISASSGSYRGWIGHLNTSDNNRKAKFYDYTVGPKQLAAETEDWERVSGVIGGCSSAPGGRDACGPETPGGARDGVLHRPSPRSRFSE
jgi:hypothetical protein